MAGMVVMPPLPGPDAAAESCLMKCLVPNCEVELLQGEAFCDEHLASYLDYLDLDDEGRQRQAELVQCAEGRRNLQTGRLATSKIQLTRLPRRPPLRPRARAVASVGRNGRARDTSARIARASCCLAPKRPTGSRLKARIRTPCC